MTSRIMFLAAMCIGLSVSCDNSQKKDVIVTGILTRQYIPSLGNFLFQDSIEYHPTVTVAYFKGEYIDDAKVQISSTTQAIQLSLNQKYYEPEHRTIPFYQDTANVLEIVPGNIYDLRIELSDGRVFTSTTRIPLDPKIIYPPDDTTLVVDIIDQSSSQISQKTFVKVFTDPSSWVQFTATKQNNFDFPVCTYRMSSLDSIAFVFKNDQEINVSLEFATLDSNFSKQSWRFIQYVFTSDSLYSKFYSESTANIFDLAKSSNIRGEGGIGVFGSYSSARASFKVRRKN